MTVCHWFSYHVLLLPVFKVKYPPPSSLENFISLNSQIRILKPEKGIGATKPPALETPLDPLPESKKSTLFFTKKQSTINKKPSTTRPDGDRLWYFNVHLQHEMIRSQYLYSGGSRPLVGDPENLTLQMTTFTLLC